MADLFADIDPWEEYEHYAQRDRTRQDNIDTKSNFSRGLASGWDQMVGMLAGGVGLAGDAVGMDSVRDWGFEKSQQRMDEASLNPLDVQNFTDIDSAGDAADWFTGAILGQLSPSVGEALVSTMLGGGVAGLAARKLAKEAIETAVQKQVANGVRREVAEKIVAQNVKKAGANIGMTAGVGAMEGGGMWGEDAETHGVENANAGSAAALGLISGASELVSPGGMLVKRIAGVKKTGSPTASKLADTFLGRLGTKLPKAMSGEAAQEVFQSFLGMLNKKVNDPNVSLTDREAILEYINSGAAGAAGGVIFGGVGAVTPEKPNRGVSDAPFNIVPPSQQFEQVGEAEFDDTIDDVFAERDADKSIKEAMGLESDIMGEEMDYMGQELASILDRRKANITGRPERNQNAFERGVAQGGYQDYSPELPPQTKAGFDPLMDEWAGDAVSLAQQEQQRGDRQVSARALPPGQGFEMVGQPKDRLSAEVLQTKTRAALRRRGDEEIAPALDRMLSQLEEGDSGGMNYDAEAAEKNQASMAGSSDHITWSPSTNPEWLKLKTLKALDKKNGGDLAKTVNRGSVRKVLGKVMRGEELTDKQEQVYQYLKQTAQGLMESDPELLSNKEADRLQGEGFEFRQPENVPAGSLKPGDEVVVSGKKGIPDKVTHQGYDKDGNAILKDGVTIHADPFEQVRVLARKEGKQPPDPELESRVLSMIERIREQAAPADLANMKEDLPVLLRLNPEVKPYEQMLAGAIDKRIGEIDKGIRQKAPGTGSASILSAAPTRSEAQDRKQFPGTVKESLTAEMKVDEGTARREFAGTAPAMSPAATEGQQRRSFPGAQYSQAERAKLDRVNAILGGKSGNTELTDPAPAKPEMDGGAVAGGPVIIEHTTKKGKVIRGIVHADLTKDQAKEIDPYSFQKDGGWFIREKYLTPEKTRAALKPDPSVDSILESETEVESEESTGEGITQTGTAPGNIDQQTDTDVGINQPSSKNTEANQDNNRKKPEKTNNPSNKKDPFANNKVFTADAVERARTRLQAKRDQLSAGFDPELMQDMLILGGAYFEAGTRRFADWSRAVIKDVGEVFRPYLRSTYEGLRHYPGIDKEGMNSPEFVDEFLRGEKDSSKTANSGDINKEMAENKKPATTKEETDNVSSGESNLERNSEVGQGATSDAEADDGNGPGSADRRTGDMGRPVGEGGVSGQRHPGVSTDSSVSSGERSDSGVDSQEQPDGFDAGPAERDERGGSREADGSRAPTKQGRRGIADHVVEHGAEADGRIAGSGDVKPGVLANIRKTLPQLFPEQQEDVEFIEKRIANERGVMLTNGTGTGKTYSGLGAIKRFVLQDKNNILIVAPGRKVMSAWVNAGKDIDVGITELADKKDAGKGVVVTSYANFGDNDAIVRDRSWDLIVFDESHYLMKNQGGETTAALSKMRAATGHRDGVYAYAKAVDRTLVDEIDAIRQEIKVLRDAKEDQNEQKIKRLEGKLDELHRQWMDKLDEHRTEREKHWQQQETKVLMLSATPFAYEFSLDYAEGFLFHYTGDGATGYNDPDARQRFYVEKLGYRMRYNKLTQPEADVDRGLLQRNLNTELRQSGALRGRQLDVGHDYSREFVSVDDLVGNRIDEGFDYIFDKSFDREGDQEIAAGFAEIAEHLRQHFKYHHKIRLLEAIKAKHAVPRVKKHLALGRKVVVFHSRIQGGGFHPFVLSESGMSEDAKRAYAMFKEEKPELIDLNLGNLDNPIELFGREFGDRVTFYNGTISNRQKIENPDLFNRDDSGVDVIMVQDDAGQEGISLHDTTGNKQRVLVNLGLPVKPTQAIQIEGRIFRVGQASDAVFEYFNTGTNFERWTFGSKISERASTAENLAHGEQARALKESFVSAFEETSAGDPSSEQGKGGKERDGAHNNALSEFDKAITYYYANQKKTGKNKAREGKDYYATPEPLGLKMVEWAGVRPGESVLEPSAGHGAIARFFPESASVTAIEPSDALASSLSLRVNGRIERHNFEDLAPVNKYDAVVMNPPFGMGGKTAVEHLAKAAKHLRNGGRVVAIIPEGPSSRKRFDKWYESKEAKNMVLVGEYLLPSVAFERAATKVNTRVVILDKYTSKDQRAKTGPNFTRDYRDAGSIKEFFERIEESFVEPRMEVEEEPAVVLERSGIEVLESGVDAFPFVVVGNTYPHRHVIKNLVPSRDRKWDSSVRGWVFREDPTSKLAEKIGRVDDDVMRSVVGETKSKTGDLADLRAFLDGKPVSVLTGNEFTKEDSGQSLISRVAAWYKNSGFSTVYAPLLDLNVRLDRRAVKDTVAHGIGRDKAAAFAAVPDVLRLGMLAHQEKVRGGPDGSMMYHVVAPVTIGGREMVMDVLVRTDANATRMYIHEVVPKEKLHSLAFKTGADAIAEQPSGARMNGVIKSVLQNIYSVKQASVSARKDTGPFVSANVDKEIVSKIGQRTWNALRSAGKVRVITSDQAAAMGVADLPGETTQGFVKGGTVYLIEENIEAAKAWSVLLHELGVHAGMKGLLGSKYDSLLDQVRLMRMTGNKKVVEAWERIPEEDRKDQRGAEELVAYLVENNPELSVVQRIISAIKAWLADFLPGVRLNEKDVVALAHAAVRREGKNALARNSENVIGEGYGNEKSQGDDGADPGRSETVDGAVGAPVFRRARERFRTDSGRPESDRDNRLEAALARFSKSSPFKKMTGAMVRSFNFKEWFGKSVLRRERDNAPGILYHGTPEEFFTFDLEKRGQSTKFVNSGLGFFFSPSKSIAQKYSKGRDPMAVFLRMEKPYMMHYEKAGEIPSFAAAQRLREKLMKQGYDGIIIDNKSVGGKDYFVVFEPNQIKSAKINTGEFSRENDDIRRSVRATTQADPRNLPDTGRELARQYFQQKRPDGWVKKALAWVASKMKDNKGAILGAFTLQQLNEMYGKKFPAVQKFYRAARDISGLTNKLMTESDELHREWAKIEKGESNLMASVMHLATIHGLDPDTMTQEDVDKIKSRLAKARKAQRAMAASPDLLPGEAMARVNLRLKKRVSQLETKLNAAHTLQNEWATLKPESKKVYRKVRDMHTKRFLELRDALEEQVLKTLQDPDQGAATLKLIRLQFEKQIQKGPYFPLSRFGDFVVTAKLMNKKVEMDRAVSTFETSAEAEEFAAEMEKKGYQVVIKVQKDFAEKDTASAQFAQEVASVIANKRDVMGDKLTDRLLDDLNQAFIKSLPDLSFRKHFVHRKGVAGFSQDALRSFASAMQHSAHHIARIKHGSGLTDSLNDLDTDLKTADGGDQTLMGEVRNELVKRDKAINNPNIHPAAQFLTSLGFVWNIGPSIASGIVNMTQTPLVTGPYLAARYGGDKARSVIIKASTDYARKSKFDKDHGWTLQDSKDISADENKMFQELVDQGVIDVTQAHDLAAAAGTDYLNLSGSKRMANYARAMKIVSWPFHVTELANRQVSSLAAYRLARDAGKDHAAAVEAAGKAVMDTHFDYSQENRARHMQGNVARVILLFKQYSQNMTFLLGRSLHQALKGESEEVKRIAKVQLYGIVGGHFLVSGALGMPFIGVAGGALNMLASAFGDDDEPWEWDIELRNYLADTVGKDAGEAIAHGPMRLVIPFDIAGRLSLADLWYRKPYRELEGRAAFQQQLQNVLGPTASNAAMWYSGATAIADGDVVRGLEMMMPKAIKDIIKTGRYADEGVRNWKDDVLIEELNAVELAGQIIGFTPRRVSEMYESKSAIMNTKTKIERRRSKLLNKMVQARLDRDSAGVAAAQGDINEFNRANPDFKLTMESVYRSMQNRKKIRENTKGGTYLPETKAGMREYGRFANME